MAKLATHTPGPWEFEPPNAVLIPVYNHQAGAEGLRLRLYSQEGENRANA